MGGNRSFYQFGVEIEIIAQPCKPGFPGNPHKYEEQCNVKYFRLAMEMQRLGLEAEDEPRYEVYKSRRDFSRWTIMKDRSLEEYPLPEYAGKTPREDPFFI